MLGPTIRKAIAKALRNPVLGAKPAETLVAATRLQAVFIPD